ncbi:Uu.00g103380.m01.CDS01 [Anthostomella pinea]|uniref:Uu.00g103380.m01.CDS01 n=1 Tax=Anthostomella pinea TaxID=933095 RepID=A0AAI8V8F9_9PEZI|nr:Uu.00g103380.m01.CDS01 [Anthostomella pinea]
MKILSLLSSLLPLAAAKYPTKPAQPSHNHTVWLCGDSTMAPGGGHNGTEGFGKYLQYSFDSSLIRVNNSAYAGRSARTFTREGRFQAVADKIVPGDWVVIEFGHNDDDGQGTVPANDTKSRVDCPGMGNETCIGSYNNQTEIVQTYVTYLRNASSIFLSLGARVIISPPTPTNPYLTANGSFAWAPTKYSYYSWYIVSSLGGPNAGIYYVDHSSYCAQALELLGADVADAGFPMDNTHTSPYLADVVAKAFVLGVKCGTSPLQDYVVNATSRIQGPELGSCLSIDDTLPI